MNHNIEIIRGRPYRYDADFDAYYAVHPEPESTASKYAWIVMILVLAAICYYIEYARF